MTLEEMDNTISQIQKSPATQNELILAMMMRELISHFRNATNAFQTAINKGTT